MPRKWAESGVSLSDPRGGVSRRHSRPATRGPKAQTDGRRDREMLDRSTAPDKQLMLPFADRRGEASVGATGGNTPVTDERVMEGVVERRNLFAALARVKTNGGSPGIDGLPVDGLPGYLRTHWPALRASAPDWGGTWSARLTGQRGCSQGGFAPCGAHPLGHNTPWHGIAPNAKVSG